MGRQANVSLPDTKQRRAVFWGPESSLLLQLLNFDQKDFTESLKDRTYHSIWTLDPIFFLGKSGQNCRFGNKSVDNIVTWQQVHSLTKKTVVAVVVKAVKPVLHQTGMSRFLDGGCFKRLSGCSQRSLFHLVLRGDMRDLCSQGTQQPCLYLFLT